LVALFCLVSCQEGDPPRGARCGTFEACGGDVVGTWGIEESCARAHAAEGCPTSTVMYSSYNRTGTYQFSESGELVMTERTRYSLHETVPLSCLDGASCVTFESLLESDVGGAGQTVEADATCRESGSSCSCDVTASITEMLTGSYELDGSILVLSNGAEYDYCVDGTELSLKSGTFEVFFVKL
jgi:hypothetical protein